MQQHSSPQKSTHRGCSILLGRRRRDVGASRRQRDGGYLLLAIMLMMAFLVITFAYVVAPAMVQQIKRDREEEMIHRGTEYARAIKKFYKKNGRYPVSLDDLDKGQIRYLRKRYTDPLTKDGKWKLLRYGDILTLLGTAGPGVPAGALGQQGGALNPGGAVIPGGASPGGSNSPFGSQGFGSQQNSPQPIQQQQQFNGPGAVVGFPGNSSQGSNQEGVPTNSAGGSDSSAGNNQQSAFGSNPQGGTGGNQSGPFGTQAGNSPFGSQSTGPGATFGGGAIVGVASASKEKTIRIYNKKKTYDEWQFIYNPVMDQQNVLLRGPYQPTTISNTNIGTPAGQLNQQNGQQNQSPFGQPNNGFGQQNNAFGQPGGYGQQQPQQPSSNQNQQ